MPAQRLKPRQLKDQYDNHTLDRIRLALVEKQRLADRVADLSKAVIYFQKCVKEAFVEAINTMVEVPLEEKEIEQYWKASAVKRKLEIT